MMKAGVPLLQAFDIVGKGATNPAVARLLVDIKTEVETGSSLAQAFRKYPLYFDALYCNLVAAGEAAGILEALLDRLAIYKEKTLAIKSKIKSALFYPVSIIVVAVVITAVIMIFVIPAFKSVFSSFGADLPAPTLVVMAISDWIVANWYILFPRHGRRHLRLPGGLEALARGADLHGPPQLKMPIFGELLQQGRDRALDAHAVDHVRGRRAAGRGARFRGRRLGQLRVPAGHKQDPERGLDRHRADGGDAERGTCSRRW